MGGEGPFAKGYAASRIKLFNKAPKLVKLRRTICALWPLVKWQLVKWLLVKPLAMVHNAIRSDAAGVAQG